MLTLGISCFYHDSAAAIVRDGEIIAAAQEERFSRKKGDPSFPLSAISYCLEEAGAGVGDLDSVVYYEKPALTFDRLLATYMAVAPRGLQSWLYSMPRWISQKLHVPAIIRETLEYDGRILSTPHHLAHAASAFFPSPWKEAAILTVDGAGEWTTASYGVGQGNQLRLFKEMRFPDSLGLLYSAFTYFCGFKVNSGEYKLMGLAPYGQPKYLDTIHSHVARLREDGTVTLNMEYFSYLDSLEMTSDKFSVLFGGPPRAPESRITRREMDLAASIQVFTEQTIMKMARWIHKETGMKRLCMAGGVALNCVANGKLLREGPFEDIWIQPAAGDAGNALGAALLAQHGYHGLERQETGLMDRMSGGYLGPSFSPGEVEAFLKNSGAPYSRLAPEERAGAVARAISEGKIVGFVHGRMEYGPRSLGARSILGSPLREDTQKVMNLRIKYRESFRPFAPAVLAEDAGGYFDLDRSSPYMLLVAPVRQERRKPRADQAPDTDDLLALVNQARSDIPSVTHWDYSARVQTVHRETNPLFHDVLSRLKQITGHGMAVNTSFNVRGEPIVLTPEDAFRCFMRTDMDNLYLEGYWLDKKDQAPLEEKGDWRDEFALD